MTSLRPGAAYDTAAVRAALGDATMWHDIRVRESTGSTSSDLVTLAREGAPEGTVVVADHQVAGRGRLDRTWHTPPGTGIAVSMLFRPAAPSVRLPWLPLLVGVAVATAVRAVTDVTDTGRGCVPGVIDGDPGRVAGADPHPLEVSLKWPNDVLLGGRKLAGILAEVVPAGPAAGSVAPGAVVVGVGLNVSVDAGDLPPTATSLALAGAAEVDRLSVLAAVLAAVSTGYSGWQQTGWDPEALRAAYRPLCSTLGTHVEVTLPSRAQGSRRVLAGRAVEVDVDGRLVVRTVSGNVAVSVGDVVHVRKEPSP